MARKIGTSDTTIGKMIHDDNQMVTRIKRKVHKLNDKQKQNRKTNARKLHEHYLAGNKSEYAVTIDEAWLYQHYCDQQTKKCYVKKGDNVPENWVREHDESFPKGFMVVGGITGRGPLPLMRIPKNTKISSETFLKYVLRPLMKKHLPKIYPNETDKVFYHHDKASSHTASKTQEYLAEECLKMGITYIKNKDIPVKSPDGSPMDFFGFGYLKQKLFNCRATTLDGVWKCAQREWNNVTPEMCRKVYKSWKLRLRTISKKNGEHIENTKDIHKRRIRL
jgi:hypothetical protein